MINVRRQAYLIVPRLGPSFKSRVTGEPVMVLTVLAFLQTVAGCVVTGLADSVLPRSSRYGILSSYELLASGFYSVHKKIVSEYLPWSSGY
jgi:hypothetical protein